MPSTPVSPSIAFDFLVMEVMHVAFNTSQCSFELFTKLLHSLHSSWLELPSLVKQELYEALTLAARPYAIFRRDFLYQEFVENAGSTCPRCPMCVHSNGGAAPRSVHVDGCFGISHFKKAGKGQSEAVYKGCKLMLDQAKVDEFEAGFAHLSHDEKKRKVDAMDTGDISV